MTGPLPVFSAVAVSQPFWATDFGNYTVDEPPADWFSLWYSGGSRIVEADAGAPSGKRLHIQDSPASGSVQAFIWDRVPLLADVETVVLCSMATISGSGGSSVGSAHRCSGPAGSENCYASKIRSISGLDARGMERLLNGSGTTMSSTETDDPPFNAGDLMYIRTRCWGTTIAQKVWHHEDPEPEDFQFQTTNDDVASGRTGVWARCNTGAQGNPPQGEDQYVYFFSAAKDQKPAPLLEGL